MISAAGKAAAGQKLKGILGLAMKAGKVLSGEFSCENGIKAGKARFCLIAADSSEGTRNKFIHMCDYRGIPYDTVCYNREELGHIIGKQPRAVLIITGDGFADNVIRIIKGGYADGQ